MAAIPLVGHFLETAGGQDVHVIWVGLRRMYGLPFPIMASQRPDSCHSVLPLWWKQRLVSLDYDDNGDDDDGADDCFSKQDGRNDRSWHVLSAKKQPLLDGDQRGSLIS